MPDHLHPAAFNPTDLLACVDCPHSASQHGFVFNRNNGSITFGDMACTACDCPAFSQGETLKPGGLGNCAVCGRSTQWGFCPVCQPLEFSKLP
jgi:hypothetical protein